MHLPHSPSPRSATGEGEDTVLPLAQIQKHLMEAYVDKIGYEFQHCPNKSERLWFSHLIETKGDTLPMDDERKRRVWKVLSNSEEFDRFMAKKFPNLKRYGA